MACEIILCFFIFSESQLKLRTIYYGYPHIEKSSLTIPSSRAQRWIPPQLSACYKQSPKLVENKNKWASRRPIWEVYRMRRPRFLSWAGVSLSQRKSPVHLDAATQAGHSLRMLGRAGHGFLGVWNLTSHDVAAVSRPEIQRLLKMGWFQVVLPAHVWQGCVGFPRAGTG